jgi:hypothetical protein
MMNAPQSPSLQVRERLSRLPLFQAKRPGHICDVRPRKHNQEHPCRDYARLFEALDSSVFWLFSSDGGMLQGDHSFPGTQHAGLADLERQYRFFEERNHLPAEFRRRHRKKSGVTSAFGIMHDVIDAVCQSLQIPLDVVREKALPEMFAAFKKYGPNPYPNTAIYAAMALILNTVGIRSTRGRLFTSAGIQRTLHRST